jgi:hypothetical protein
MDRKSSRIFQKENVVSKYTRIHSSGSVVKTQKLHVVVCVVAELQVECLHTVARLIQLGDAELSVKHSY